MKKSSVMALAIALFIGFLPAASAVNYTLSYNTNTNQHQTGVISGSAPGSTSYAAGTVVTVAANSGNLARQGFTFAGWNTLADGSGTTHVPGSGTLTLNSDTTLYAKWAIPTSARLNGAFCIKSCIGV